MTEFQFINWQDGDEFERVSDEEEYDEEEEYSFSKTRKLEYVIRGFGCTEDGRSVCVKLVGFKPYFYVRQEYLSDGLYQAAVRSTAQFNGFRKRTLVYKKPFVGYQVEKVPFWKFEFNSMKGYRFAAKILRVGSNNALGLVPAMDPRGLFETQVPSVVRPMHLTGIRSTGWCFCPDTLLARPGQRETAFDLEFRVPFEKIGLMTPVTRTSMAPVKVATFDIEVYSQDSTADVPVFPSSMRDGDKIIAIVTFFSRINEELPYNAHVVCLEGRDTTKEAGGRIKDWLLAKGVLRLDWVVCSDEKMLLDKWGRKMSSEQALVWTHFNGLGFDEEYIFRRARKLGALGVMEMDFVSRRELELCSTLMESNAYGYNAFASMGLSGIFHLDIMVAIKKDYKLDKYSLDNCANHFLKEAKIDLKPQAQFDLFRNNLLEDICVYCIQDVWVTFQLYKKLALGPAMIEMAGQSWVPVDFLITRGQQVKMLSSIVQCTSTKTDYVLRTIPADEVSIEGYKGATVLEPERGFYTSAIACLDFASLYPSIIRAHNLSHETLVMPWTVLPPGTETFDVEIPMKDGATLPVSFVQTASPGILPTILENWAADRKINKKEMMKYEKLAHESNDPAEKAAFKFMESVYDARQKANKVSMNSLYGFTGVGKGGSQPCPQIAASVTTIGRNMIETTKLACEKMLPGSRVIYGDTDSVFWDLWPDKKVGAENPTLIADAFEFCEKASAVLSREHFTFPNKLEFEKVFCPLLLFEKKRYSGLLYSADLGPLKPKKIDNKGLQIVRRDTVEYVKICMEKLLSAIHYDLSILNATRMAKGFVDDLFQGRVPIDQLVMSKKINSEYKVQLQRPNKTKEQIVINPMGTWKSEVTGKRGTLLARAGKPWDVLEDGVKIGIAEITHPHVHILWKQEERCPGSGPRPGDRVKYVFVHGDGLQYTKAEDVQFVKDNQLPIDIIYYYTNTLQSPLDTIFQLFFPGENVHNKLFHASLRKAMNKNRNQPEISNFFSCKRHI